VILLTARADFNSKMQGLETGADDFITKPFDPDEVMVRVKNLISQRAALQERFMMNIRKMGIDKVLQFESPDMTSADQKFVQKIMAFILKNLSSPELDIEAIASEMAVSRRQLSRKLSGITGMSPGKFIRHIRLNRAAEMISHQTGDITNIAYDVGFTNLSWFAKSFKEQFGISPSDFAKRKDG
jgi:AraC-like DNA-binding protein